MASLSLSSQEIDLDVALLLQYPQSFISTLIKWKLILSWTNGPDITVYRRVFSPSAPPSGYNPLVLALMMQDIEALNFLCPLFTRYYLKIARNADVKKCLSDLLNDASRSEFASQLSSVSDWGVLLQEFKAQDWQREI